MTGIRLRRRIARAAWALAYSVTLFATADTASAQPAPLIGRWEPVQIDSGERDNRFSASPAEVFGETIDLGPDVPWVRVVFSEAKLGRGSRVRVTSVLDGAVQELTASELRDWGNGTAFFNGSAVTVELIAGPDTTRNSIRADRFLVGSIAAESQAGGGQSEDDGGGGGASICTGTDDRVLSNEPRVGRLLPGTRPITGTTTGAGTCTAWTIDTPPGGTDKLHLTAGHCFGEFGHSFNQNAPATTTFVLQFNVPTSTAQCHVRHPDPKDQFSVLRGTIISNNGGPGNDWAVFNTLPNGATSAYVNQGSVAYEWPVNAIPATSTVIVPGHGVDSGTATSADVCSGCPATPGPDGFKYTVQQSATGVATATSTTFPFAGKSVVEHTADTCAGNSGSPVEVLSATGVKTHKAIAIHTSGNVICSNNNQSCHAACGAADICDTTTQMCFIATSTPCCPGGMCVNGCSASSQNFGTPVNHPALGTAVTNLKAKKALPSLGHWGLVALVLFLVAAGVLLRERRLSAS